ncbi:nitrate- and nitrite sensing domain-containing protein [Enterococcus faecium]|nr:nitrate- and nitrite sensing domain-containing protein [Enterococcus faecium]
MKFGTQDQAFFPRDILEKFRFIKDCGFEEYEIDGKLLIENIDTVKQAIKETGIPVVTACNGYDGWIGDFIEERRLNGVRQIAEILRALSEVEAKESLSQQLGNVHLSITADGFTPKQRRRL